jgi:hypothetical protein
MTTTFKSISAPQVRFDTFTGQIEFGRQPIVPPVERVARSEIKSFLKSNSGGALGQGIAEKNEAQSRLERARRRGFLSDG